MKSKKLFSVLVVISMIFTVGVGSLWANSPAFTDRVTVNASDEGDMLMGPLYFADNISKDPKSNNYTTKLVVMNTSLTMAVVARISFRSPTISAESLDFMLYLTPNDVWDAEITYVADRDGNYDTYIKSSDDSCLTNLSEPGQFQFATEAKQFIAKFYKDRLLLKEVEYVNDKGEIAYAKSYDATNFGHIEIVGAQAYNIVTASNPYTGVYVSSPVSKVDLYNCYWRDREVYPAPRDFKSSVFSDDADQDVPNCLAGRVILTNGILAQRAELNMTALEYFNNAPKMLYPRIAGGIADCNNNSVAEIEAAIAKPWFDMPFDFTAGGVKDIMLQVTFPTKYASNFATVPYRYLAYDMQENLFGGILSGTVGPEIEPEVYMYWMRTLLEKAIAAGFTKGYLKLRLGNIVSGLSYGGDYNVIALGTPAICNTLTFTYPNAKDQSDMMWSPAFAPSAVVDYVDGNGTDHFVRQ